MKFPRTAAVIWSAVTLTAFITAIGLSIYSVAADNGLAAGASMMVAGYGLMMLAFGGMFSATVAGAE